MDAVVLLSHGSVLCGSGESLWAHAERLRDRGIAEIVEFGYLNYTQPPFIEAVTRCVLEGATRIVVSPYFLAPGKFVRTDIPAAIEEAKTRFPDVEFTVGEVIGFDEMLAEALLQSASEAQSAERWRDGLKGASNHCRADEQCPLYGTPDCPRQPQAPTVTDRSQ